MTTPTKQRGGAREGAGRKPLDPDQPTIVTPIRLTRSQRAKLARLGGAEWVRQRIDKARED